MTKTKTMNWMTKKKLIFVVVFFCHKYHYWLVVKSAHWKLIRRTHVSHTNAYKRIKSNLVVIWHGIDFPSYSRCICANFFSLFIALKIPTGFETPIIWRNQHQRSAHSYNFTVMLLQYNEHYHFEWRTAWKWGVCAVTVSTTGRKTNRGCKYHRYILSNECALKLSSVETVESLDYENTFNESDRITFIFHWKSLF